MKNRIRENNSLINMEKKSILELLEKVAIRFTNKYEPVKINGNDFFVGPNGTVFYFVALIDFETIIVEYADNLEKAEQRLFEDGDQFDVNQSFESLIDEIQKELDNENV